MEANTDARTPEETQAILDDLLQRVQYLEDIVEELIEIALVNRAGLLAAMKKKALTREELRELFGRIEQAHEEAHAGGGDYRILPAAGAYFLESQ